MAILEPVLAESLAGACPAVVRDGMDRAVETGGPEAAALDFLMGHLRVDVAIPFDVVDFPFSDGARTAIADARAEPFVDDRADRIFEPERIRERRDDRCPRLGGTRHDPGRVGPGHYPTARSASRQFGSGCSVVASA